VGEFTFRPQNEIFNNILGHSYPVLIHYGQEMVKEISFKSRNETFHNIIALLHDFDDIQRYSMCMKNPTKQRSFDKDAYPLIL
jgi:hypothetical protein